MFAYLKVLIHFQIIVEDIDPNLFTDRYIVANLDYKILKKTVYLVEAFLVNREILKVNRTEPSDVVEKIYICKKRRILN